jgi:hypothetical protein
VLQFFKDAALTRPALQAAPKYFLFPESGGVKETSLWLADVYYVVVMEDAKAGATDIKLDQTAEIPATGTLAGPGDLTLGYTAKTANSITVAPLDAPVNKGTILKANTTYTTSGNLTVFSVGQQYVQVALKAEADSSFNLPTVPYIYPTALNQPVVRVDLRVACEAGAETDMDGIKLEVSGIANADLGWTDRTATGWIVVSRRSQALKQQLRVLAPGREVSDTVPGFVFGEHRWRDHDEINAESVVPTQWDTDVVKIGAERFVAGIGHADDLQLISLKKTGTAIQPRMKGGHYFTGHLGYYLPVNPKLEFLNVNEASEDFTYLLEQTPKAQKPVFVGRWRLDQYGYYDKAVDYRYVGKRFSADSEFDPADHGCQYTLDRKNKKLRLNNGLPQETIFVGVGTDDASVTLDMPIHPVAAVTAVYCDSYSAEGQLTRSYCSDYVFSQADGTLLVTQNTDSGQIWDGKPIFAECTPAVAVLYEAEDVNGTDSRIITDIDLNPAFAGIAKGNFYLMHRRWKPRSLQLYADKPRIPMPASMSSLENYVAFGPVFYERDYAMLLVTAYGTGEKDLVPNVRLRVVADENFQGYLNYQNPLTDTVEVITGGDGSAGLVYVPNKSYGVYIDPATSIENGDTFVLPDELPYAQVFNAQDWWLTKVYVVRNDDPYLGMVGADASKGQLPWTTLGTPSTAGYQTNGRRVLLRDATNQPLMPAEAYDSEGRTPSQPGFTGVKKLKFSSALPTGDYVGAFFLSYLGRVTLKLVSDDYGLESNSVLLQLSAPEEIVDAPASGVLVPNVSGYLIQNDEFNGILNKNRLCGGALLDIKNFNTRM